MVQSWLVEFRGGPWGGEARLFDVEPDASIDVPAGAGGPFTYVRVVRVSAEAPFDPTP